MTDIKAKVINDFGIKARIGSENGIKILSSLQGGNTLNSLSDVDATNLGNGYVLVYDANIKKWVSTNLLTPGETQNLIINGGNF